MPDLFGRSGIRSLGKAFSLPTTRIGAAFKLPTSRFGAAFGSSGLPNVGGAFKSKFVHVSLDMFFDRPGIIAKMDAKTHKVLSATGAEVRRIMQTRMRYRKAISAPGEYPSAHKPTAYLREKILFGFDVPEKSLVVGPQLLSDTDREVLAMGKTVPQLVNEGGLVVRHRLFDPKRKSGQKFRPVKSTTVHRYRPRPFVKLTEPDAKRILAKNMEKFELK